MKKGAKISKNTQNSIVLDNYGVLNLNEIYAEHEEIVIKNNKFHLKDVLTILLIACVSLAVVPVYMYGPKLLDKIKSSLKRNNTPTQVVVDLPEYADPHFKPLFKAFQEKAFVREDYVGQILFESNIINEPILQGETNNTYLQRDYETYQYSVCGPVFMDAACDRNFDENIILYGHNRSTAVDPEHVMMFSPLHVLEKQENYEENKLIYLIYEEFVEVYVVSNVYPVRVVEKEDGNQYLVKGEPLYYKNNYNQEEFTTFINAVKDREFYQTGVEVTNEDKLLTMQTCYEDSNNKLIVMAKKVDTLYYE